MKKFKKYMMLACMLFGVGISLQSCLFEEEDTFEQSAANRLTENINRYERILQGVPNGWLMEYYIGSNYEYGGIPILCRFKDGRVEMATTFEADGVKPGTVVTSLYKLGSNQSTVLSFDTYNPLIHYFGTPGLVDISNPNTTLGGDYEFVMREGAGDKIVMEGTKYGNRMVLTPLPEDADWKSYISGALQIEDAAFLKNFKIMDQAKELGSLSRSNWTLSYRPEGSKEKINVPFVYTSTGLKLREPMEVNGVKVMNFTWNSERMSFNCTDAGAEQVSLVSVYPEGYMPYEKFLGTYTLTAGQPVKEGTSYVLKPRDLTVTIEQDVEGESYLIKSEDIDIPIPLSYDRGSGSVELVPKKLGALSKYYIGMRISVDTGLYPVGIASLIGEVTTEDPFTLVLVDDGTGWGATGFSLYAYGDVAYSEELGYWDWFDRPVFVKQ